MALIISCLCNDPTSTRAILDRLRAAGWNLDDIAVLHPDEPRLPAATTQEASAEAATVGAGSGAVAAGTFGWLVGYGVLALPAAMIGATLGSVVGATVGAGSEDLRALRQSVVAYYRPFLTGSRSAILVTAEDARGYDLVMSIFGDHEVEDIQVVGKGRMEAGAEPDRGSSHRG